MLKEQFQDQKFICNRREIMELAVYKIDGKKTSKKVKLNKNIFGAEPNNHAIYLDVKQFLLIKRQGTHKAKERGEITGSTRKIKKQKGTVPLGLVLLKTHCLEAEDECLDLSQEITVLN